MFSNSVFGDDSTERTTEEELGLIGGMLDGEIGQFEFRGLTVVRVDNDIAVMDGDMTKTLGGRYHIVNNKRWLLHDWLCHKAQLYGDAFGDQDVVA